MVAPALFLLLKKKYGRTKHYLYWNTPEQLLVATILSAQCTDVMVNKVTQKLFKKYRTPKDFANSTSATLEQDIKSCGFYRNKARSIKESNTILLETYDGKLPKKMKDLLSLPGVARKTANALQQNAFDVVEGIVVDTHVIRLANRFGWSKTLNAVNVENDLMKIIPKAEWGRVPGLLKAHGKAICKAPQPKCEECFLDKICPSAYKFPKYNKTQQ